MDGEELQQLVDGLAESLGRSVAIDDSWIRLIVASRHFGDEDPVRVRSILSRQGSDEVRAYAFAQRIADWRQPGWLRGSVDLQAKERLCAPIRCHGVLLGYLWLIDADHSLTEEQVAAAGDAAERAGLVLYRRRLLVERDRSRMERLLRDLISADPTVQSRAVEQAAEIHRMERPFVQLAVASTEPGSASTTETELEMGAALERWQRAHPSDAVLWLAEGAEGVLLTAATSLDALSRFQVEAARLHQELTALGRQARLVGTSDVAEGWRRIPAAYAQAQDAVLVARRIGVDGGVVAWPELGGYGFLMALTRHLPPPYDGLEAADALVRADPSGALLATAERYLAVAGDARRAAAALHVHRSTLYYRLQRIAEVTGLDLQDGRDRLTLHLAVTMRRLRP